MRHLKYFKEVFEGSPLLKLTDNVDYDLIDLVRSSVPKGSKILEISCGNGSDAKYLKGIGYNVTCTDINPEYCNIEGVNCIVHNTKNKFPFKDKEFALVYSRLGLHYFTESELDGIFNEISRISNNIVMSVKLTNNIETGKVILSEDKWSEVISKHFQIEEFEIKEGLLYGDQSKWLEVLASNKINEHMVIPEARSIPGKVTIYQFYEEIKHYLWSVDNVGLSYIKKQSEHFIGPGFYKKVEDHVTKIFDAFHNTDIGYINDRLKEIYDEHIYAKRYCKYAVLMTDLNRYKNPIDNRYNGARFVDMNDKDTIIVTILRDVIAPTLIVGGYNGLNIRTEESEMLVSDEKYQCINFNLDNFRISDTKLFKYRGKGSNVLKTPISDWEIQKTKGYNAYKMLDFYQPGIYINIGESGYKLNMRDMEVELDKIMPSILSDLDYREVIWDAARGHRKFDDNTDVEEYSVKILLNS